jgi:FtsP/CotA-like multicopper oxidase with cupredoxin domain
LNVGVVTALALLVLCAWSVPAAFAVPCTGAPAGAVPAFPGSDECILDPLSIPKYVIPLVIPPVMNNNGTPDSYDIAVREFAQQILPGGIWNTLNGRTDTFPGTTVWSYGPAADPTPALAPDPASQFNYPAYTFETMPTGIYGLGAPVSVRWINELVQNPDDWFNSDGTVDPAAAPASGNFIPHLLPVDQTLHWANPAGPIDTHGTDPNPYNGPVPLVTHVHGAHVDPHSDGYPEAWWLPAANNISGYFTSGSFFDDATGTNDGTKGWADYLYRQDQPATTLWYHDHSLGMTRSNVYAGPAGFWLIRGGANDLPVGVLPGPAPTAGQTVLQLNVPTDPIRQGIREIPVVIQDRSFQPGGGQLFYQGNRAFFEGLNPAGGTAPTLQIPFAPTSDIAPIWNPEAFFTTMVVNGVTWPSLEVAPALYRVRLLNGCNSRFLNLAMFPLNRRGNLQRGNELPFYQIGAEQGFLPQVVKIETGYATLLPGDGTIPRRRVRAANRDQALLMGLAERADVLVDFRVFGTGPASA